MSFFVSITSCHRRTYTISRDRVKGGKEGDLQIDLELHGIYDEESHVYYPFQILSWWGNHIRVKLIRSRENFFKKTFFTQTSSLEKLPEIHLYWSCALVRVIVLLLWKFAALMYVQWKLYEDSYSPTLNFGKRNVAALLKLYSKSNPLSFLVFAIQCHRIPQLSENGRKYKANSKLIALMKWRMLQRLKHL